MPDLALRQLAAGAIGMTCATVAEAESLVRHGVRCVLIANEIADPIKIGRFIDLARRRTSWFVSTMKPLSRQSRSGPEPRNSTGCLGRRDVGLHRCGVQPGEPAVRLAKIVVERGLRFRGLMGYEGRVRMHDGPEKLKVCAESIRLLANVAISLASGHSGRNPEWRRNQFLQHLQPLSGTHRGSSGLLSGYGHGLSSLLLHRFRTGTEPSHDDCQQDRQ